jgi:hypothetical protein
MENVGIFYGHLEYIMSNRYILWPLSGYLVYFPRFGLLYREKSGNPVDDRHVSTFRCFTFLRGLDFFLQDSVSNVFI